MRDVDSMTIQALQGLDANAANQAALDLIQNSFDVTAKFDQAQALNNELKLQKLKAVRASQLNSFKADSEFRQKLVNQRNKLTEELFSLQDQERKLQATAPGDPKVAILQQTETAVSGQITAINNQLSSSPPTVDDAQFQSADTTAITSSSQPPKTNLGTIPDNFANALTNILKQPSYPPAVQMDNVIDLLHQRIAREFSVIYDDLMRDSERYDVYLVQFDISIQPKTNAHDRNVRVILDLSGRAGDHSCADSAPDAPLAYELYPSAAAYNVLQGFNQTTHVGISGIAQTLFGWGLQASFQHDHSRLRSGLSQSLYTSGFGAGQYCFGWDFAPSPYQNTVAPGLRTTYAILRVPKDHGKSVAANVSVEWPKRDRRYPGWNPANWFRADSLQKNSHPRIPIDLPLDHKLRLAHVSYVPVGSGEKSGDGTPTAGAGDGPGPSPTPTPAPGQQAPGCTDQSRTGVIQVRFRTPIDPNLVVTANDQILRRVRDVRGRGLYTSQSSTLQLAGNSAEAQTLSNSRFGLLESDRLCPDTWFQADARTILLNVSLQTAGTNNFPVIRILDPSSGGGSELTELAREADEVRIDEWFFAQPKSLTPSAFVPLLRKPYEPGRFDVAIQKVADKGGLKSLQLRLISRATTGPNFRPIYLHDHAQVILEAYANDGRDRWVLPKGVRNQEGAGEQAIPMIPNWALDCRQDRGALVCSVPLEELRDFCAAPVKEEAGLLKRPDSNQRNLLCLGNYKVWLDQAPYFGRAGLWGDSDLKLPGDTLETLKSTDAALIARGGYEVREERRAEGPSPEYQWIARLETLEAAANAYEIPEFADILLAIGTRLKNANAPRAAADQAANELKESFGACKPGSQDPAFTVVSDNKGICFAVPFRLFSFLPEKLHLQRKGDPASQIEIPNLRQQLIPQTLKIMASERVIQFQGERLHAVNGVRLVSGDTKLEPKILSRSINVLEVDAAQLQAGTTYYVQLGIGGGPPFGSTWVDLVSVDTNGNETPQVVTKPPSP
jgi:hypothetical protein